SRPATTASRGARGGGRRAPARACSASTSRSRRAARPGCARSSRPRERGVQTSAPAPAWAGQSGEGAVVAEELGGSWFLDDFNVLARPFNLHVVAGPQVVRQDDDPAVYEAVEADHDAGAAVFVPNAIPLSNLPALTVRSQHRVIHERLSDW